MESETAPSALQVAAARPPRMALPGGCFGKAGPASTAPRLVAERKSHASRSGYERPGMF
jgi:hypothetical protein